MAAAAEEIVRDEVSGHEIAQRWGLEYVKPSSLSVDPGALSLLSRDDCRRLRAVPLATGSKGPLVVLAAPSEERFAAIRELTGDGTRFALISDDTLDALLGSRMFADSTDAPGATAPPETPSAETSEAGAEAPASPETDAGLSFEASRGPAAAAARRSPPAAAEAANVTGTRSDGDVEGIVSSVLAALEQRMAAVPPVAATAPKDAPEVPRSTSDLLAHVDSTMETWSTLRGSLAQLHTEFEDTKRALRETKEQLSVAHADNDQLRKRVRTLDSDLAESRAIVVQARARLQEAADLLAVESVEVGEPAEFI
jgi:hypothetical protein